MIRIEAAWLAAEPLGMRVGTDTVLAQVLKSSGPPIPTTPIDLVHEWDPSAQVAPCYPVD
jgi:hypothetical protein